MKRHSENYAVDDRSLSPLPAIDQSLESRASGVEKHGGDRGSEVDTGTRGREGDVGEEHKRRGGEREEKGDGREYGEKEDAGEQGGIVCDTGRQGRKEGGRKDERNRVECAQWDRGEPGKQRSPKLQSGGEQQGERRRECRSVANAKNGSSNPDRILKVQPKFLTTLSTGVTKVFVKHSTIKPEPNLRTDVDADVQKPLSDPESAKLTMEKVSNAYCNTSVSSSSSDPFRKVESLEEKGNKNSFSSLNSVAKFPRRASDSKLNDLADGYTVESFPSSENEAQQRHLLLGPEDSSINQQNSKSSLELSDEREIVPEMKRAGNPRRTNAFTSGARWKYGTKLRLSAEECSAGARTSARYGNAEMQLTEFPQGTKSGDGSILHLTPGADSDGAKAVIGHRNEQFTDRGEVNAYRFSTKGSSERLYPSPKENDPFYDNHLFHRYTPTCNKTEDEGHDELSADSSSESGSFFSDMNFSRTVWRTLSGNANTINRRFSQRVPIRNEAIALKVQHPLGSTSSSSSGDGKLGRRRTRSSSSVFSRLRFAPRTRRRDETDKPPRIFSTPSRRTDTEGTKRPRQQTNSQSKGRYLEATLELAEMKRCVKRKSEPDTGMIQSFSANADLGDDILGLQKRHSGTGNPKPSTPFKEESETSASTFTQQSTGIPRGQSGLRKIVLPRLQTNFGKKEQTVAPIKTNEYASVQGKPLNLPQHRTSLKTEQRQRKIPITTGEYVSTQGESNAAARNRSFSEPKMITERTHAQPGPSRIPKRWHETTFTTNRLADENASKYTVNKTEPEVFFKPDFLMDSVKRLESENELSEEAATKKAAKFIKDSPDLSEGLNWGMPAPGEVTPDPTRSVFKPTNSDTDDKTRDVADSDSPRSISNAFCHNKTDRTNVRPPVPLPRTRLTPMSDSAICSTSDCRSSPQSINSSSSSGGGGGDHSQQGSDNDRISMRTPSRSSSNGILTSESEIGPLVTFPRPRDKVWKRNFSIGSVSGDVETLDRRHHLYQLQLQQLEEEEDKRKKEEGQNLRKEEKEQVSAQELRRRFSADEFVPASPFATYPRTSRGPPSTSSQGRIGHVRQLSLDIGEEWEKVNSPTSSSFPSPTTSPPPSIHIPAAATDNNITTTTTAPAINDRDKDDDDSVFLSGSASAYPGSPRADRKNSFHFPPPEGVAASAERATFRRQGESDDVRAVAAAAEAAAAGGDRAALPGRERQTRAKFLNKSHQTSAKLRLLYPRDPTVLVSLLADPEPGQAETWRGILSALTAQELLRLRRENSPLLRLLGETGGAGGDGDGVGVGCCCGDIRCRDGAKRESETEGGKSDVTARGSRAWQPMHDGKNAPQVETRPDKDARTKTREREGSSEADLENPDRPTPSIDNNTSNDADTAYPQLQRGSLFSPVSYDPASQKPVVTVQPMPQLTPCTGVTPAHHRPTGATPGGERQRREQVSTLVPIAASEAAAPLPATTGAGGVMMISSDNRRSDSADGSQLDSLPPWKRRRLLNPFNAVNQRCHSTMQCPCCFFFCFLCCLPAVIFMGRSDHEFDHGSLDKARRYGRRTTVMYFVGGAVAVVLLAVGAVVTVLFLQEALLRGNRGWV